MTGTGIGERGSENLPAGDGVLKFFVAQADALLKRGAELHPGPEIAQQQDDSRRSARFQHPPGRQRALGVCQVRRGFREIAKSTFQLGERRTTAR